MIKRTLPFLKEQWVTSLERYLEGYNFNNDGANEALESALVKDYIRMYALTVNSTTNGIFMALYAWMKRHPGRNEVIVPNWGYPAAFKVAMTLGLTVVPIDINEETLGMDLNLLYEKLSTRTLAVIHIENNGIMGDVAKMYAMVKENDKDILFIEDAAPSMLQVDAGRFGDVALFSFSPTKPFLCGEGGAILTDDDELYKSLRQLRHTPHYNDKNASLNCRLSPFLAAYVRPQLYYKSYLSRMREIVHMHYSQDLNVFSEYTNRHGAIMYLSDKAQTISDMLSKFSIEHRYQYYPCFIDNETLFPVSCKVKQRIIDLPIHHHLQENQIKMICNLIKRAEEK